MQQEKKPPKLTFLYASDKNIFMFSRNISKNSENILIEIFQPLNRSRFFVSFSSKKIHLSIFINTFTIFAFLRGSFVFLRKFRKHSALKRKKIWITFPKKLPIELPLENKKDGNFLIFRSTLYKSLHKVLKIKDYYSSNRNTSLVYSVYLPILHNQ